MATTFSGDILTFQGESIHAHPAPYIVEQMLRLSENAKTLENMQFYETRIFSSVFAFSDNLNFYSSMEGLDMRRWIPIESSV